MLPAATEYISSTASRPQPPQGDGTPSMLELLERIKTTTLLLNDHLVVKGLCSPSFAVGSFLASASFEDVREARQELIIATEMLRDLALGPAELLETIHANDVLCMQAVHRYQIATCIDFHETIPFQELSKRSGLNVVDLRRILRLVMTRRVFCEPRPDHVAHTAASWLLVENNRVRDFSGIICDERFPASARVVDALMMYGQPRSPEESGFSLANQTKRGLYEELKHFPARQARWTSAMSAMAQKIDFNYILENFPLRSNETAMVVDVGGGNGTISLGLARRLPNVAFLVQDAPDVIHDAKVPEDLQSRIMYQAYNFFQPQPVSGARVYYFRNVFHNWPDDTCVQILKNHVGIMEVHTILVIDDFALHEPLTVSPYEERRRRNMDITMLTYFGSRERTIREWEELLAMADVRFRLQGVAQDGKQPNTILEVGWSV